MNELASLYKFARTRAVSDYEKRAKRSPGGRSWSFTVSLSWGRERRVEAKFARTLKTGPTALRGVLKTIHGWPSATWPGKPFTAWQAAVGCERQRSIPHQIRTDALVSLARATADRATDDDEELRELIADKEQLRTLVREVLQSELQPLKELVKSLSTWAALAREAAARIDEHGAPPEGRD